MLLFDACGLAYLHGDGLLESLWAIIIIICTPIGWHDPDSCKGHDGLTRTGPKPPSKRSGINRSIDLHPKRKSERKRFDNGLVQREGRNSYVQNLPKANVNMTVGGFPRHLIPTYIQYESTMPAYDMRVRILLRSRANSC